MDDIGNAKAQHTIDVRAARQREELVFLQAMKIEAMLERKGA